MTTTIYLTGDWKRTEFAEARDWMTSHVDVVCFDDISMMIAAIKQGQKDPEHALLVQTRPGQFQQSDIDRLRSLAPLTNLSVLLGSWCEGETRSGTPLANITRLPWHAFKNRMQPMLVSGEAGISWVRMPITVAPEDQLRAELRSTLPSISRRIGIYSADLAQVAALSFALDSIGHQPVALRPGKIEECDLVIWDDAGGSRSIRVRPEDLRRTFELPASVPCVTVRTFARIQDADSDRAFGFAATLAKPFQVADLLAQIESSLPAVEDSKRESTAA